VGLGCLIRFEVDCERKRFARGANAHLGDDETVAKMGHPILCLIWMWATRPHATVYERAVGLLYDERCRAGMG
jgi:hypothetical protein